MSNRSYPADFSRPLRDTPVLDAREHAAMLARLKRRCAEVDAKRRPSFGGSISAGTANIDAASSAGQSSPAGGLHVSATADKTTCAGGGSQASIFDGGALIQPTRPAPIKEVMRSEPSRDSLRVNVGGASTENTLNGPGSGCEAEPVTPISLAPSAPALQWERISQYAMRTTCGTWTCCKVMVGGYPRYELWGRIAGLERPVCVRRGLTAFLEAQDLAEAESCV